MTSILLFFFFAIDERTVALIQQIAASGQVVEIAEPASGRLDVLPPIPPGAPPLLSFRLFEGKSRHRFGDLDLVLDDAGH
jgi:hypothetical protein